MSKVVEYQGHKYLRIWWDGTSISEISKYCPSFMMEPADFSTGIDLNNTNTLLTYASWSGWQSIWEGHAYAWGPSLGDSEVGSNFQRIDSSNDRVCLYFGNYNESHEDDDETKPVKPYFDFSCDDNGNVITRHVGGLNDSVMMGHTRCGIYITDNYNGTHPCTNLEQSGNVYYNGLAESGKARTASVNAAHHLAGNQGTQSRFLMDQPPEYVAADSFMLFSKLPIFINYEAAHEYIENGTINPETCLNSDSSYNQTDKEYYIQSKAYLYNNKNEQPYAKDSDPNKLYIKVKGRVHGYVQRNRDKYNIALVVQPNDGEDKLSYWAGHYGSPDYSIISIDAFNNTEYKNNWNTWKEFEPYSVDRWVRGMDFKTNIYIYATKTAAEDAFDDPSIIPINYDDVEDSPENTTGDPVNTSSDLIDQNHGTFNGMLTLWQLNGTGIEKLGSELSTYEDWSDKESALKIYGESPINALVSIYHCSIDLNDFITKTYKTGLAFGSHGISMPSGSSATVDSYGKLVTVGSCIFNPIYGDYRDYTNFTYELHLPFSNPVTLDTREVIGKSLVIKATIDPYAMQMRYYLIINGAVYRTIDVAFGTQIGVVGNDAAGKAREMRQDILSVKEQKTSVAKSFINTVAGSVGAAAKGDWGGALAGLANGSLDMNLGAAKTQNAQMNQLQDAQLDPTRTIVGQFSPGCAESDILYPYLVTYETRAIVPAQLEATYGRPANIISTLGSVSGYTCAELARVAVNCTEAEKAEIEQLVNGGIII